MAIRNSADVTWTGDLKSGRGEARAGSGSFTFEVTFGGRFEGGPGTNPEELIAAAHAVCYSMALANTLAGEGSPPARLETRATVTLETGGGGPRISGSVLTVKGSVPGLDAEGFRRAAETAEKRCPVSNALRGNLEITLDAKLA